MKQLPINTGYTVHEILVPSLGKKLRFRPFLVRENKALMIAQSSENVIEQLNTLKSIVQATCVEDQTLDVDKLTTFDFEYLLIMLRSISIDKNITLKVTCDNDEAHEGMEDQPRETNVLLDLTTVEVVGLKDYNPKVKLSDDLMVIMKITNVEMLDNLPNNNDIEQDLKAVSMQIDKICTTEEVFDASEYTPEQMLDWIENLTQQQLNNLLDYFKHIPYCRLRVEWTCPTCGKKNIQYIEGISYFF